MKRGEGLLRLFSGFQKTKINPLSIDYVYSIKNGKTYVKLSFLDFASIYNQIKDLKDFIRASNIIIKEILGIKMKENDFMYLDLEMFNYLYYNSNSEKSMFSYLSGNQLRKEMKRFSEFNGYIENLDLDKYNKYVKEFLNIVEDDPLGENYIEYDGITSLIENERVYCINELLVDKGKNMSCKKTTNFLNTHHNLTLSEDKTSCRNCIECMISIIDEHKK